MTILPPPRPRPRHKCAPPDNPYMVTRPLSALGTLWECPTCGRWWKYGGRSDCYATPNDPLVWAPVRWYDVPARRRIATHETEKHGTPTHWWDCHPNPKRGQP